MIFKNKPLLKALVVSALSLSAVGVISAQEKEHRKVSAQTEQVYVISAKAGGVSYVSGAVRVDRIATQTRQVLAKGDEINDGDIISVGDTGNAEVLLNPGSFLRLAENTDVQFTDTALESLLLKMKNGSALIEASAIGEEGADITIVTPHSTISLEKSGIYRLNVNTGSTEVLVWKGAATAGSEIIRSGRKAVLQKNAPAAVAKFDKDDNRDDLDIWSKSRAKELAKANNKLRNRDLTRAFNSMSSGFFGFNRLGGFWLFNRLTGAYCYVPYGYSNWGSPYGYGYSSGIYWNYNPYNQTTNNVRTINPNKYPEVDVMPPPGKRDVQIYSPPPAAPPVVIAPPSKGNN